MTAPVNTTLYMRPDRNLALELVRVTEAGAMAAGRWVGRGDKEAGDGAAVDAMRQLVALVSMRGGGRHRRGREGRSADALQRRGGRQRARPGLRLRRRSRRRHHVDGQGHAECDLGAGGGRARPSAVFYMEKIAVGPDAADAIDITAPVSENLRKVAKAKKSSVSDLTVCILDRPRHAELNARVRETGARIRLISDGDVAGAIAAARPESGTDLPRARRAGDRCAKRRSMPGRNLAPSAGARRRCRRG